MIETIPWRDLPFLESNRLFLDYIEDNKKALDFYTHGPTDYQEALRARQGYAYPRQAIAALLEDYHQSLGASEQSLANIEAIKRSDTFCVVTGQQAGLLGGPAYTAYKIIATIRLARHLSKSLDVHVVPVFWLASEDHDFGEINHTHYTQPNGEVGRVSFDWHHKGRPIADLSITNKVLETLEAYWEKLVPGPHAEEIRALYKPETERYCDWLAGMWLRLFADDGLIVVEPRTIRPPAGKLFASFINQYDTIQTHIQDVAERMEQSGYEPLLSPESAGLMFTFDEQGKRVRIEDPQAAAEDALQHPEHYSTDAALRALFADAMLPSLASTLGAGEIAYQGMLRTLYELFEIPQPILFPRKSYTIISAEEHERLKAYGLTPLDVMADNLDLDAIMKSLMPPDDIARFENARSQVQEALAPLKPYLEDLDPNMSKTWEQALNSALRHIDKLEERAVNASLSRQGYSKHEIQTLRNALVPRGRLQERTFPLTHFLHQYGLGFLETVRQAGELEEFAHDIITLEDEHA